MMNSKMNPETTMEAMIEAALAEMEAKGEKLEKSVDKLSEVCYNKTVERETTKERKEVKENEEH